MKKLLCFIFVLLLTGCSYANKEIENSYTNILEDSIENETISNIEDIIQYKQYDISYSSDQSYSLDNLKNGLKMNIQIPLFILENTETSKFNEEMNKLYDECFNSIFYRESKGEDGKAILGESPIVNSKAFLEQYILSIVIFKSGMIWESSLPDIEVLTYNYSLKENRFLSNEELFDILNLDMDDIEKKLSDELTENYIKDTVLDGEKISEYNPDYTECIYYDITNESKIYLDKGIHFIIRGYSGINKKNYDIKI